MLSAGLDRCSGPTLAEMLAISSGDGSGPCGRRAFPGDCSVGIVRRAWWRAL